MIKKIFQAIFLFFLIYTFFAFHSPEPVWARYNTGVCCEIGNPQVCGEGNYVCNQAVDETCRAENKGECYLLGPYDVIEEQHREAITNWYETGEMSSPAWLHHLYIEGGLNLIDFVGGQQVEVEGQPGAYQREGGAISTISNLVGTLYVTQPASSIEYLADVGKSLGLASPAYAQGLGWTAFSPVLSLWKTFRNISYLAFVIIFVIVGFMIMFRAKIDPQTVISIQNALPRIIVTLILITFSYAIAGLMIDLSQLSTRIVANILKEQNLIVVPGDPADREANLQTLLEADIFKLVNPLRNIDRLTQHLKTAGIPGVGTIANLPVIGDLTVAVIFWIAGFFMMFKIFFALIGPYIAIILSVIFAPFQILIGALPGSSAGFSGWFKQLLANILVFPATFILLAIAAVFKGYSPTQWIGESADWGVVPGAYSINWFPATIGNWGAVAGDLISFAILFTVPKVVEMIQAAFQIKASPWGGAAAEEIKAGIARIPLIGDTIAKRV